MLVCSEGEKSLVSFSLYVYTPIWFISRRAADVMIIMIGSCNTCLCVGEAGQEEKIEVESYKVVEIRMVLVVVLLWCRIEGRVIQSK